MQTYHTIHDSTNNVADAASTNKAIAMWTISTVSLTLATTMICTILIICKIVIVGRANHDGIQLYKSVIEILVESALLYSITYLVYTGLVASDNFRASYVAVATIFAQVSIYYI